MVENEGYGLYFLYIHYNLRKYNGFAVLCETVRILAFVGKLQNLSNMTKNSLHIKTYEKLLFNEINQKQEAKCHLISLRGNPAKRLFFLQNQRKEQNSQEWSSQGREFRDTMMNNIKFVSERSYINVSSIK